jgi:uncharacterized phage protein (TIGR02216 family)
VTDWPALIRLAAVRFHIAPEAFWRLSVKEWGALTTPPPSQVLGRQDLNTLMTRHPDKAAP